MPTANRQPSQTGPDPLRLVGGTVHPVELVPDAQALKDSSSCTDSQDLCRGLTCSDQAPKEQPGASRFGDSVIAGLLAYGSPAHVSMEPNRDLVVTVTVRARTTSLQGIGDWLVTTRDHVAVLAAERPLQISGSANGRLLSWVLDRAQVERRLERLLGHRPVDPLRLDGPLSDRALRLIGPAVQMVLEELRTPSGLSARPTMSRHLHDMVIDAILMTHPHNYTEDLNREVPPGTPTVISRAASMMEESPTEPWTVDVLAQKVHLSVRALQYGFKRDLAMTPMAYLRSVRLRTARAALLAASPGATTVRAVAIGCGFTHMSRFARAYRHAYGEAPSTTLARPPDLASAS